MRTVKLNIIPSNQSELIWMKYIAMSMNFFSSILILISSYWEGTLYYYSKGNYVLWKIITIFVPTASLARVRISVYMYDHGRIVITVIDCDPIDVLPLWVRNLSVTGDNVQEGKPSNWFAVGRLVSFSTNIHRLYIQVCTLGLHQHTSLEVAIGPWKWKH